MLRSFAIAGLLLVTATPAFAHDDSAVGQAPPQEPYTKVADVLPLPEFIPGLGILYVDPARLPAGPFLAYDRSGRLSATVYMTPLEDLQQGRAFDDLQLGAQSVSSVDIYYNAGHPGVEAPHAHVVLYHDGDAKTRLAE